MRNTILFTLCLALTSCALVPRQEYSGPKKPKNEISIIKGFYPGFMKEGFLSQISGHSEIKNGKPAKLESVGNDIIGYPKEIHLLPAQYIIQVHCFTGGTYSDPFVRVDAKAGNTYVLRCEMIPHEPNEAARVRVIVDSVTKNSL
jgi:hypothetical protein